MKTILKTFVIVISISSVCGVATAKQNKAAKAVSLDDLLRKVKSGYKSEDSQLKQRERQFLNEKVNRQQMLQDAEAALAAEQRRSEALEVEFDQAKVRTLELEQTLKTRLGTMGEMFGVIRQVAGDTRSQVTSSLVSSQFPGRAESLEKLATSKSLPSVNELEHLWYILQHEMTESGKVTRFKAPVIASGGKEAEQEIVRVGVFNAVSQGKYLNWSAEQQKLAELGRQPPARYMGTVGDLEDAKGGLVNFAVDPSRGAVLSVLVQTPGLKERIEFGGVIGYITISLGIFAFLLGLWRLGYLGFVSWKVHLQAISKKIKTNNPLGRIINIYHQNAGADTETLEFKLDEAIITESNKLSRALWVIKIASVVAPLMGLLGTVTGMIQTFQAITLFGTGDPKLMAGGISEALVTTMLGLMVAIPLVLLHSGLKSLSTRVVEILEEQSTGFIAQRAEKEQ